MALAVASIFSGFPRIFTVHGVKRQEARLWQGKEYFSHQMDRILEYFVHRNFYNFIAVSLYVSNLLNKKKRIFNISNPVSKDFFFTGLKPLLQRGNSYIFFIGPLVYLKQAHILIEAFIKLKKDFPALQLTLCGNKDDKKYYKRLTDLIKNQNASGINFINHLSREGVKNYLKNSLVFVLPSLQENSPMVIAEAMALGIPVIASRVGGIPYMIEHKKIGLLFSPGNVAELVKCLGILLRDKKLYQSIRYEAHKQALRLYRPENIAAETVKVYRELLQ